MTGETGAAVDERAQVLSVERGSGRTVRALLSSPQIARSAKPMQFVMVKVRDGADPFLRRPFSLSLIRPDDGLIGITWDVVGRGTEIMALWEPGQEILVLGPLGNGLEIEPVSGQPRRLYLIAGGTGLAPMFPLAEAAKARGWDVSVFYGARSAEFLLDYSVFDGLGCHTQVATDDGSLGRKAFVTDLAAAALAGAAPGDLAVSCGPIPMTRAVKALCSGIGVDLLVSLEERMACGTGLCKGCAVKAAVSEGYYHVCSDGPVFRAQDVDLGGAKP
ncbi:MAG: dihydroorotate dehydrogenase electron transfer subunit [Bacillota bacterium]